MVEHEINKLDNFICGWYPEDTSFCDKIIDYFEANPNKVQGHSSEIIDLNIKNSMDSSLEDPVLLQLYLETLKKCCDGYTEKYPYCNYYAPWGIIQEVNIQKYEPMGGFYEWHTERSCREEPYVSRHMVYMTYLNDVTDAGETEFMHQKIKVKPQKGLTLMWPADWTFTHRGITSPTQTKYIVTGWFNFLPKEK